MGEGTGDELSRPARLLRAVHTLIGLAELGCLGYLWFAAVARRRDRCLQVSLAVLMAEGVVLVAAKGCPLGIFQRRAGDEVPMFELWFGPRLAPAAIPAFTTLAVLGAVLVLARPPKGEMSLS